MSNTVTIRSNQIEVSIALIGAEVRSVKNRNSQHEYMWSGNSDIWAGVSPTLFPVVGKTTDGVICHNGKKYPQGNHGFARNTIFSVANHVENKVQLEIITNELGDVYPFNLKFAVIYEVIENKLVTTYQVTNLGNELAYFSVGAHPAFKCPFDENTQINDYSVEFSEVESNLIWHEITPQAFFTGKTEHLTLQSLPLTKNTFVNDAIIYNNYTSQYISIKENNSSREVRVSLTGFPFLGLWSKVGANYVCIEPWCGHSDMLGFNGDIAHKAAIEKVEAQDVWVREYSIEFRY